MCEHCCCWDSKIRACMLHNTVPGGCKDFQDKFSCADAGKEEKENYMLNLLKGAIQSK